MSPAPITISWSALRAHGECRQRAFLLRSGKRNPAQDLRGYFHGMVVDRVMRDWLADPTHPAGAMPAMVTATIESCLRDAIADGDGVVRWKSAGDRAEMTGYCIELVTRLEPLLRRLVLAHRFQCGHRFRAPVTVPYLDGTPTTITLTGEMDLLVQHDATTYVVWDLKGTRDDDYWRKVLGQLVFYDLAVLATHGVTATKVGLIQPMCTRPVLEFYPGEAHRRQMWAAILRMAADIWRADHTCKPTTAGCTHCDVRHACQRFQPTGNTIGFGAALRQAGQEMR